MGKTARARTLALALARRTWRMTMRHRQANSPASQAATHPWNELFLRVHCAMLRSPCVQSKYSVVPAALPKLLRHGTLQFSHRIAVTGHCMPWASARLPSKDRDVPAQNEEDHLEVAKQAVRGVNERCRFVVFKVEVAHPAGRMHTTDGNESDKQRRQQCGRMHSWRTMRRHIRIRE